MSELLFSKKDPETIYEAKVIVRRWFPKDRDSYLTYELEEQKSISHPAFAGMSGTSTCVYNDVKSLLSWIEFLINGAEK